MTQDSFQWDPGAEQTYNKDKDLCLPGSAQSFNKDSGKSFTMDAPGRTLTLQTSPGGGMTVWSPPSTGSFPPTVFDIRNGNFVYDGAGQNKLFPSFNPHSPTNFTIDNNAQFRIENTEYIWVTWPSSINVKKNGSVAVSDTGTLSFTPGGGWISIMLTDGASFSATVYDRIQLFQTEVDVTSTGVLADTYALDWVAGSTIAIYPSKLNFSGASRARLRAPALELGGGTRISTSDTATSRFQFDSPTFPLATHFELGSGTAKMQFDGYSGNDPFDFLNRTYFPGLFIITSHGVINSGELVIQNPNGDSAVKKILEDGLIAIDAEIQHDSDRLDFSYDAQGYTHIRQKS